ncbi:MAG TPA: hypothetical protein VMT69_02740 [Kineosporiaceae bacterium]|nr:hypothetical protein [Kineosporiaceae bacterium]
MTDTSSSPDVGSRSSGQAHRPRSEPTGWVGWIVFAAVMMIMVGVLHVIEGFVALFKHEYYVVGQNGLLISVNYTAWGWVHIIAGIIVAAAGAGLFSGRMWARVIGVIVAVVSLLLNFSFLSAYPVWSAIMITIDVLIIYALTVHGREIQDF